MSFTPEQTQWLDKTSDIAGARVNWKHNEDVKSKRLTSARENVLRLKESLRALSDFEVEVTRAGKMSALRQKVAGNKKVSSMKGTEKGWKVLDEFDFGHYEGRVATEDGNLPPEIQERVDSAMELIGKLQDQLQHANIEESRRDDIRNDLKGELKKIPAAKDRMKDKDVKKQIEEETKKRLEVAKELAKKDSAAEPDASEIEKLVRQETLERLEKERGELVQNLFLEKALEENCTVQDIQFVRLSGELDPKHWDRIKQEIGERDDEIQQAGRDLDVRSNRLKKNRDKLAERIANRMEEEQETEAKRIAALQMERKEAVEKLAKELSTTVDVINDIVGLPPVFDDLELRRELWQPLVREGVIPSAMVPEDYSEVVQQFSGADQLYRDRTESEYELDPKRDTKEKIAFAQELTNNILGVVAAGMGGAGAVGKGKDNVKLEQIGQIGEHVVKGVKAVSDNVFKTANKLVEKQYGDLWEIAGSTVGGIISSSMPGDNASLAKVISTSIQAGSKGVGSLHKHILGPLAKGEKPNWDDAAQVFADVVASAFTAASAAGTHKGQEDEQWAKVCSEIATYAPVAFKGIFVGVEVGKGVKSGEINLQKIGSAVEKACQTAVATGLKNAIGQMEERSTGTGTTSFTDEDKDHLGREKGATALSGAKSGIDSAIGTGIFEKLKDFAPDGKKLEKAMAKMEAEATEKELTMELKEFRQELVLGFGFDVNNPEAMSLASDTAKIDNLIKQIERDRAILQMTEAIFDTGFKTAAEFFEPLKAVSAGKDMIKQMIIVAQRAVEFHKWRQLNHKALTACSTQGFAFANRVMNVKVQISDHALDAVCELAKVIGAAGAAAGMAGFGVGAQAGKVITKSAEALQGLKNIIFQFYRKNQLRKAWKKYLKAIANPQDRILKYEVLKSNPTLSKYAMAYAALFEDDVIARHGLKVCGLSEESLKHQDTDAHKVVAYLETKFNEDPILIRKLTPKTWQKDVSNELTFDGWNANRRKAIGHKDLLLDPGSLGRTEGSLLKYFAAQKDYEQAVEAIAVAQERYEMGAVRFVPAMQTFRDASKRMETSQTEVKDLDAAIKKVKEKFKQQEKSKDPDRQEIRKIRKECRSFRAASKLAVARAEELSEAAGKLEETRSIYPPLATDFSEALDLLADQKKFVDAAKELRAALRSGNPKNTDGATCEPFAEYMEALALRARMAENDAQQQFDRNTQRKSEVESDLKDAKEKIDFESLAGEAKKLIKDAEKADSRRLEIHNKIRDLAKKLKEEAESEVTEEATEEDEDI